MATRPDSTPPGDCAGDSAGSAYTHRMHAFVKPRTYRIDGDRLLWAEQGQDVGELALADILEVRLRFHPSRAQRNKYHCRLVSRKGGSIELTNTSYESIGNFSSHDEAYAGFVRRLLGRLVDVGADTRFAGGQTNAGYAGTLLVSVFIAVGLLFAFWFFIAIGVIWIAFIKAMLVLFYLPTLVRYIGRNRPIAFDPRQIPERLLPA